MKKLLFISILALLFVYACEDDPSYEYCQGCLVWPVPPPKKENNVDADSVYKIVKGDYRQIEYYYFCYKDTFLIYKYTMEKKYEWKYDKKTSVCWDKLF